MQKSESKQKDRKVFTKLQRKHIWKDNLATGKITLINETSTKWEAYDCNNVAIHYAAHNNRKSQYGWNIDHIDNNRRNNTMNNLQCLSFKTHDDKNRSLNK